MVAYSATSFERVSIMKNKSSIKTDLMLLEKYLSIKQVPVIEKNKITRFKCADEVYPYTNEPLKLYYDKNLDNKRVLTVTSSSDHALHAVLAGAKDITCFDINRFCKYYAALKIAMIKKYDYEEYLDKMEDLIFWLTKYEWAEDTSRIKDFAFMLFDLSSYLKEDEKAFFQTFIRVANEDGLKNRFLSLLFLDNDPFEMINNNDYLTPHNYAKLKEELNNCNIKYVDSNVNKLCNKKIGKYDVIYLSNILSTLRKDDSKLLVYLRKLLNDNGIIYDCAWDVNDYVFSSKVKKYYDANSINLKDGHVITTFFKK